MLRITRHGESLTNADLHKGSAFPMNTDNNVLTRKGIGQALGYGEWAKDNNYNIEQIVASPYARTKQTAFLIASALETCVPIEFDIGLKEIQWERSNGIWEHFEDDHDILYTDVTAKPFPDTECQSDVYNRVVPTMKSIIQRHKGKNILLVTHYFVCRAIMSHFFCGSCKSMPDFDPKNLENISYSSDFYNEDQ